MKGSFTANDIRGSSTKGGRFYKEYKTWQRTISKCHNVRHHRYKNYGGRGFVVDDFYRYSFLNFLNEIGECPLPVDEYTIERVDNDKGYVTGNMIWLKAPLQALNKSNTFMVDYKGKSIPLIVLCRDLNIKYSSAKTRMSRGESLDNAISQGRIKYTIRKIEHAGKVYKLTRFVKDFKMNYERVIRLYNMGYTAAEIINNPLSYLVRKNNLYEYNNKKLTISAWAKEMKISPMTIRAKMANGYSFTFLCDQYFNHKDE
jgi:hypothetical protein